MYKFFSQKIVSLLIRERQINNVEAEMYEYCFELLLSTLFSILSILVLSIIGDVFIYSLIFLVVFIVARLCCGGYHAKNHLSCFFTTLANYIVFLILFSNITNNKFYLICIFNVFSLIIVILLSPIENKHNPLSSAEKKKHKYNSILISILITILSFIAYWGTESIIIFKIICSASIGLLSAAISMILGQIEICFNKKPKNL